jgi:hypothetical protein
LAEVVEFGTYLRGSSTPFVTVAQESDSRHNWEHLAALQTSLRAEFGKNWAHPDPDYRPEFNEW